MARGWTLLASGLLLVAACAQQRAPVVPGPPVPGPVRARGFVREGDVSRRAGRVDEALAIYRRAIDADRGSVPAHLRHVGLLLAEGRGSEARAFYVSRVGGTVVESTMYRRLQTDGSPAALREVYELARQTDPGNAWWRLALSEIEIVELADCDERRQVAGDRGDPEAAREIRLEEMQALRRARYAVAVAVALEPRLPEAHLYRGTLLAVEAERAQDADARALAFADAAAAYQHATYLDATLAEAWEGLGEARIQMGDPTLGLKAYLRAVELMPFDPQLRMALGALLQGMERHEDAADQFGEAALLAPRVPDPWIRMGDARADAAQWEEALDAYAGALARDGTAIEVYFKRAAVFEQLGRYGDAVDSYKRYVAQDGERSTGARRRIERLLRLGEGAGS